MGGSAIGSVKSTRGCLSWGASTQPSAWLRVCAVRARLLAGADRCELPGGAREVGSQSMGAASRCIAYPPLESGSLSRSRRFSRVARGFGFHSSSATPRRVRPLQRRVTTAQVRRSQSRRSVVQRVRRLLRVSSNGLGRPARSRSRSWRRRQSVFARRAHTSRWSSATRSIRLTSRWCLGVRRPAALPDPTTSA
jgi:hypothetical protein